MKEIVIEGKLDLTEQDVPVPVPLEGEVRLKVEFVGICGSDLHYYFEGVNGEFVVREPLVPGHEMSGRIDLDPSGRLAPGTPVTVHPARFGTPERGIENRRHLWPNGSYLGSASTWPHTQGAMAQYLVVRADMVRPLPPELPLRRAALAEPLAVALHGINEGGGVQGARVLVSGAGPIGLLAAAAAKALGAAEVTCCDVLDGPLGRARDLGVDKTIKIGEQSIPANSYDVVLECSGAPSAVNAAGLAVRRAGTFVQIGMLPNTPQPINLAPFISKEVNWHGSFRFDNEIDEAILMLAGDPRFDAVITHVLPAAHAGDAFSVAKDSQTSGKVVVSLWPDD